MTKESPVGSDSLFRSGTLSDGTRLMQPDQSERESICLYIEREAARQRSAGVRLALRVIAGKVRARFDEEGAGE